MLAAPRRPRATRGCARAAALCRNLAGDAGAARVLRAVRAAQPAALHVSRDPAARGVPGHRRRAARRWCSWCAASTFRSRRSSRWSARSSSGSRTAATTPYSAAIVGGADLRHGDRAGQRHAGRGAGAERADRHAGGRRDHVRRSRSGIASRCRRNRVCRRAGGLGRSRISSVSTSSVWVAAALVDPALRHAAQDDDRTALLRGRRQSARGLDRRHQGHGLPDAPPSRVAAVPLWRGRHPALGVHPQSDAAGRRSLSARPDRRRRPRRHRDVAAASAAWSRSPAPRCS